MDVPVYYNKTDKLGKAGTDAKVSDQEGKDWRVDLVVIAVGSYSQEEIQGIHRIYTFQKD